MHLHGSKLKSGNITDKEDLKTNSSKAADFQQGNTSFPEQVGNLKVN